MCNNKVLVGIVTYSGKNYCFDKFIKFLKTITYKNIEIIFVDNSVDDSNKKMIIKNGFNAIWLRKGKEQKEIMANCNEWLREYAINNHFSHLLSLESDIFPCPDFIEIMLAYEKPVIGLPYFIGQLFMSYLLQFNQEDNGFERQLIPMGNALSFFKWSGQLKKVLQIGLGCLLLHKSVLKCIRFVITPEYPLYHADSSLHLQLQQLGVPVYLCPDYICRHENKNINMLFTENVYNNSFKYKDFADD